MTAVGEKGDEGGEGGGATVLVGIKFDADSKQMLTWALVKVAQPGDQVIALHILDSATESPASILSLVKQFDYTLAVYEGFCNLKQVDLKLKVCRGSSLKKSLVREAKSFEAAKLILGTTKTHNPIQSSTSVAKFCAKKLPKCFSVYAVQNGKIVFRREAIETNSNRTQDNESPDKSLVRLVSFPKSSRTTNGSFPRKSGLFARHKTLKKNCEVCASALQLPEISNFQSLEELSGNGSVSNKLDLIPFRTSEGNDVLVRKLPGWSLLRRALLPKRHHLENSSAKKSVDQWVLRLPSQHSSAVVYPDLRQNRSDREKNHSFDLDGVTGAIVPVGCEAICPPSPCNFPKELQSLLEKSSSLCRLFSYQELLEATSCFMPENMVGKGGSSHVFRGCLPDGKELAVKIVKPTENAIKEFVQEIQIITSLNHKNLISLFGFCFEENKLLLVYDFLSRGSLEENLHGNKKGINAFGWQERHKVAVGLAEALDYLHNGCEQPVIHRDVKSSNILLSDDFDPQLSDFGLASRVSSSASHTTSMDVAGTFGYLAPEYLMHGKMSDKIDVYAFGIVLLELLSGKKPIDDNCPKGQESLVMWAKPILKDSDFSELLDPELGSSYECHQIERMILAATLCVRRAPLKRPQVSLILKLLLGDQEVTNWAQQEVKESEEVDIADDELYPTNMECHLNLALLDLEDDSHSTSSNDQSFQIEVYLQKRWSRSPSFA
ncbi:Kinase protein with adenine nucleotide alpha hydrolases-like domain, putative isoform 5 [Hibiscus syriacus]|uniref:Kinase protein with adenine nucleotide alpha hydrolases-like domain, putative isoform 5 n=1 Tax=Hibiscus syriacus TaxID=106335 RepID=A0A6A3AZQ6_HIBSY|nr:probable LRR receptor-like serine/threonine-protein kinase At1g07560 [Hibiscus syriacus]KAE8709941.1 Kinase protein with adenine nucleotide alpha hydrolases-like domain, putative isoform 5 [Hibiscus syriacus]